MKLSKRDIGLIILLLGVAAGLGLYFAYVTPTNEANDIIRAEINSLNPVLAELKAKEANRPLYEQGIEDSKVFIKDIKSLYPPAVLQENQIMYTVDIETNVGVDTDSLAFIAPSVIMEFDEILESGEVVEEQATAYKTGITLTGSLTYGQMKELVGFIYDRSIKTTLETISLNYNAEDGALSGTMNIAQYFMVAPSDPYIPAYIPSWVTPGVSNLFGSFEEAAPSPPTTTTDDDGEG